MDDKTRLIRAGKSPAKLARTVGPPIQRGSTVLLPNAEALYDERQTTYGRQGLAAQATLIDALCELEGARHVSLYPSGLAALAGAMLAVLSAGDEVLVADCVYKPTRRFCEKALARYGVTVRFFPPRIAPEDLLGLATPATKLIVTESPGSMTFELQDVPAIARLARQRGILSLHDNTWGAGLLFKPLAHGVDISVQALTKYVGGHSDAFMGSAATANPKIAHQLHAGVLHLGWAVSPDDAYQMLRGLRTLPMRIAQQGQSGLAVAAWLAQQPEVSQVLHPGLPGSPDHALWARHYSGASGLFGFAFRPAPEAAVNAFLNRLKLFGLGFSWGGYESLAISAGNQLDCRADPPVFDGPLTRVHIGLEAVDDLLADLRAGLDAFAASGG